MTHELTIHSVRPVNATCSCGWAAEAEDDEERTDEQRRSHLDYEHRRHCEKVETAELQGKFEALAKGIVFHLDGWTLDERPAKEEWLERYIHFKGPGGAVLSLHYSQRENRINVSGEYARRGGEIYPYSGRPASINVSPDRTPHALAKDIQRRFIPAYLEAYAKGRAQAECHNNHENEKKKVMARLSKLAGVEPHKDFSLHMYRDEGGYFDVTVDSADSVRLDIRNLPVAQAEQIIRLILGDV